MINDRVFWQGFVALPILIGLIIGAYFLFQWVKDNASSWWLRPKEFGRGEINDRIAHACTAFVARRIWTFKLPGNRVIMFRSVVGGKDYQYGKYWSDPYSVADKVKYMLLDEFLPYDKSEELPEWASRESTREENEKNA